MRQKIYAGDDLQEQGEDPLEDLQPPRK